MTLKLLGVYAVYAWVDGTRINNMRKMFLGSIVVALCLVVQMLGICHAENAYTLVKVSTKGDDTITKFELNPETNKLEPKYYQVVLTQTEYGTGDTTKYYEWTKNAKGNNAFSEVSSPTEGKNTITAVYDSTVPQLTRINNSSDISSTPIEGNFIGQYVSSSYANGGAIYNSGDYLNNSKIGNITGDFIGNYASSSSSSSSSNASSNANGGAIYNSGSNTKIGDITGDFVGNYVSSPSSYYANANALGGAIYNDSYGTIGNITGNFIGNYASSSAANGGAIYNGLGGTIGDITGNFVDNYAKTTSATNLALGGAVYTYHDLSFTANGKDILFSGNYTEDYRGKVDNAIFVDTRIPIPITITLKAENNGTITFNDQIDGGATESENGKYIINRTESYKLALTGDDKSKIILITK